MSSSVDVATRRPPVRWTLLDPLRGLAALWVFLFHYRFSHQFLDEYPRLVALAHVGDYAVPLFFIISGYCIILSAQRTVDSGGSVGRFLSRRCLRILPTFWCSILCILALRLFVLAWSGNTDAPNSLRAWPDYTGRQWLAVILLAKGFFRDGGWWTRYGQINGAYWSLAIEFQFYGAVALMALHPRSMTRTLIALTVVSVSVHLVPAWNLTLLATGMFLPFWSWFACGILLYYLHSCDWTPQRLIRSTAWGRYAVVGMFFTGCGTAVLLLATRGDRFLFCLAASLVLWCLLTVEPHFGRLAGPAADGRHGSWLAALCRPACALLMRLGAMSYTLYLVHNELAYAVQFGLRKWTGLGPRHRDVAVVLLTVAGSYALYLVIERPFVVRRAGRGTIQPIQLPIRLPAAARGGSELRPAA